MSNVDRNRTAAGPKLAEAHVASSLEVDVLLATYNGERFIANQLESILAQSFGHWRILLRDDGSTDQTKAICQSYARAHPDRIRLVEDTLGNLGVVECFGRLLSVATAPYVMFCDQDDVWLPDKIAIQLEKIKGQEANARAGLPVAVFTDALVVDTELRPISDSLLRYINRQGTKGCALNRLCVEGNCYGCTMILNRALVERVGSIPPGVISHDWWCGLVAAALGRLVFADCAPIKHRRHASNASQTKKSSWRRYLRDRSTLGQHRRWIHRVLLQAEVFAQTYAKDLSADPARLFADLARVRHSNWFVRRYLLARHGIRTTGLGRNLGFFLAL